MKKLSFISILLLLFFLTKAQENYIIINGGLTVPKSDFANTDFSSNESGFATNGFTMGFEVAHFFNPWIGVGGAFKFSNSGFNSDIVNNNLSTKYANVYDTIHLTSSEYNLQNFLVGPYGKLDINKNFSLFGKAFIGIMSSFRPDQTLYWKEYGQDEELLFLEGKLASSFAWNFGGGLIVKLNDRMGFSIMADYISGNPKFEEFDYDQLSVVSNKQNIKFINYTIGLTLAM